MLSTPARLTPALSYTPALDISYSYRYRVPENKTVPEYKTLSTPALSYTPAGAEFQNEVPAKRYDYTLSSFST